MQALTHRPDLLVLDGPTSGLDPLMQQAFHEIVREVTAEGRTVFLSSHVEREACPPEVAEHADERAVRRVAGREDGVDDGEQRQATRPVDVDMARVADADLREPEQRHQAACGAAPMPVSKP